METLFVIIPVLALIVFIGSMIYDLNIKPAREAAFKIGDFTVSPFKTDRKTGFPALPEGWNWTVYGTDKGRNFEKTVLSLVNDGGIVVDSEDWYTDIYMTSDSKTKQTLLDGARKILRRYKRNYQKSSAGIERFYGSYPPKSL